MKRGMAVLRSACLTLGLLMTLGSWVWAQAFVGCPMVTPTSADFGPVALGASSAPIAFTVFCPSTAGGICDSPIVPVIIGANPTDFSLPPTGFPCPTTLLGPGGQCTIDVVFQPLGCGTRTAVLVLTAPGFPVGNCGMIPLTGFGCSFDCAINATQNASGLSPTVRDRILRELFLAQADAATRCAHLNCALCLAQPEALRGRAGAQDIVDQILCLLKVFACPLTRG
jgi:hypothetical protein